MIGPLEREICEGCSRVRYFPWPAVRVSRLCAECLDVAARVQAREARAIELVRTVRGLWGLRKRLRRWLGG